MRSRLEARRSAQPVRRFLTIAIAVALLTVALAVPPSVSAAGICTTGDLTSAVTDTTTSRDHTVYSKVIWRKTYYCNDPYYSPIKTAVVSFYTKITMTESLATRLHYLQYGAVHQWGNEWTLEATYPVYFNTSAASGAADCTGECTFYRTYTPRNSSGGLIWMTYGSRNFVRVFCRCSPADGFDEEAIWHWYTRSSGKLAYVYAGDDIGCSSGWCP